MSESILKFKVLLSYHNLEYLRGMGGTGWTRNRQIELYASEDLLLERLNQRRKSLLKAITKNVLQLRNTFFERRIFAHPLAYKF